MLEVLGDRQQVLLRALHEHKEGLTIDELARQLNVTRTAIKQHLGSLEKSGYVKRGLLRIVTRGRPGRAFTLSAQGIDLFPKQYSWFSSLLLGTLKTEGGSDGLATRLRTIGKAIAASMSSRVESLHGRNRLEAVVGIMNELSYEARLDESTPGALPAIQAHNCVYHHLAQEYPEVCAFDLEILERLSGSKVNHQECIVRGGTVCRFVFTNVKKGDV